MIRFICILLSILYYIDTAHAGINPILKVSVDKSSFIDSFYLRLFDDVAPVTVNNFLNYANGTAVNGGSYDNSFIHRNSIDFVIQGGGFFFNESVGGFTYDSATQTYTGGLQKLLVDPTIVNEFSLSNVRGTIAMAKKDAQYTDASSNLITDGSCIEVGPNCLLVDGTGPDSANSQWFINLVDSPFLDYANGGFTVFGEILQDSMPVIDDIASTASYDLSDVAGFKSLPLTDYILGEPVRENNLIKIISMNELFKISSDEDFGDVDIGSVNDRTITIITAENKSLVIGEIANIKQLSAPFSIIQNECENTTLNANTSCDLTVRYAPTSINTTTDEFNIEFSNVNFSYTFRVRASNAPDISINRTTGEFGFVRPYDSNDGLPEQVVIIIENIGVKALEISTSEINFTSGDGSEFQVIDNCANLTLEVGDACAIPVNFIGTAFGDFSFTLTVVSNDPDEPRIEIPFTAIVVNDSDGVADVIENQAPNNGDANFDGIIDSLQSHVASLPNKVGEYITLVTSEAVKFTDVVFEDIAKFRVPFDEANQNDVVLSYTIPNLIPGVTLGVGLFMPEGFEFDDYMLLTLDTNTFEEKWSSSKSDGAGGVSVIRSAQITKPDGGIVNRDLVTVILTDGGYGDTDLLENGVIDVTGLLLVQPRRSQTSDGLGQLNKISLLLLYIIIHLFRKYNLRTPF